MSRNRRRNWLELHLPPYVPRLVAVGGVTLAALALVYLRIGHKCSAYSAEIKRLENQCVELDNERVREETKWNAMKSADQLDALLVRHGLLMVYPSAGQVVRMNTPARGTLAVAQGPTPNAVRNGGAQTASRAGR
jgi:hypothetical protein